MVDGEVDAIMGGRIDSDMRRVGVDGVLIVIVHWMIVICWMYFVIRGGVVVVSWVRLGIVVIRRSSIFIAELDRQGVVVVRLRGDIWLGGDIVII
jgi:hypothetical protein